VHLSLKQGGGYLRGRAQSDEEGRFAFEHVPEGGVQIEAFGEGFVRTTVPVPDGEVEGLAVVMPLAARLHGIVVDARTGEPVDEFVVRFVAPRLGAGERRGFGYGATWGREGRRFSGTSGRWDTRGEQLEEGTVFGVEVTSHLHAPARDLHVVATAKADAPPVTLRLGQGALVVGTVLLPDGAPAVNATLRLLDPLEPPAGSDPLAEGRSALPATDARGRFRVERVPPGSLLLAVEATGFPPVAHGPVEVGEAGTHDVGEIRVAPGGTLAGVAADDAGRPLAGVEVVARAVSLDDVALRGKSWKAVSGADGRYLLTGLPAARLHVSRATIVAGRPTPFDYLVTIDLAAGERRALDLVASGTATLRGRVDAQVPLPAGARVTLMPKPSAGTRADPRPTRSVEVRDGRFEFVRADAGAYLVLLSAMLPADAPGRQRHLSAHADVTLADGGVSEVVLEVAGE
jgi:hypothetical protein